MDTYSVFSSVYDEFMDNIPYDEWVELIQSILYREGIEDGLILDLACGTGTICEKLSAKGYEMIGVDNSLEMLERALRKKELSGHDILYLHQDMREFELYGTVRAIVCLCDSVNYILEPKELLEVFRLANHYLDPDGILIFDFNTEHKYKDVLGNHTIAENREDKSYIWENYYYEEERINEIELTLFIQDKESDELYHRYKEVHYQRGYTLEEMTALVKEAGLDIVSVYFDYSDAKDIPDSERVMVVAREKGKEKV